MAFPKTSSIETPILQELVAVGGSENVRFLYQRLPAYFPQISFEDTFEIKNNKNKNWRVAVQKAGKSLDERNLIRRERGFWSITEKGRSEVETEMSGITTNEPANTSLTHSDIQEMLVKIGESLGYFAVAEFEYYDVVWRETAKNQRLSHIFEVQSKGNIDSAFAKLKRAYEAQRTKPFLIISTEPDYNRAVKSLNREFHEIEHIVTILTFAQIQQVYLNLASIAEIIKQFLLK
ncbi:MAG: hypothetical protein M3033_04645 [Acidobacteriota bacterium]|nr:hypothetical protein [Acidobacteriota bacterium]